LVIGNTLQFTATAFDANNTPVTSANFTWVSSDPAVATVASTGLATGLVAGATNITATSGTITSNIVALTVTCAGIPATVTASAGSPTPATISTFGSSSISVTVTDCNSNPVADGTQVTFSVSPTSLGVVTGTSTNPATTSTQGGAAVATSTFTAGNTAGTVTITAASGSAAPATQTVTISSPAAGSIQYLKSVPTVIGVKGSGQSETSIITFGVSDVNGNPVSDGTQVNFEMIGPSCTSVLWEPFEDQNNNGVHDAGEPFADRDLDTVYDGTPPTAASSCPSPSTDLNDEYLSPVFGSTVDGVATTILHSGKVAGPVLIQATVNGRILSSAATGVSVGGGVPSASHFHISTEFINLAGHTDLAGYDDQTTLLTAYLADRFGNSNVLTGTAVSFYTEAGHLVSNEVTTGTDGTAGLTLTTQGTVPINLHPWLNVTSTSQPAQVVLDWDPPNVYWIPYTVGVVYDIYRNANFNRVPISLLDPANPAGMTNISGTGWDKLVNGQVGITTYTDATVVNNQTYYYYVVARDAQGRLAESPILSATPRVLGNTTDGVQINEQAHAEIFTFPSVIPNPILTTIRNPRDGWVTIMAVTQGEEAFSDTNGNGVYDAGEQFIDTNGEPFLDADDSGVYNPPETFLDLNQNGIFDMGEPFTDANANGRYDYGDPFFIDVDHDTIWDAPNGVWDSSTLIWEQIKLVFSGELSYDDETTTGFAPFNTAPQTTSRIEINSNQDPNDPDRFRVQNGGCTDLTVFISDANLNRLIPGTTITIGSTAGKLVGPGTLKIPDGLSTGPYIFGLDLCDTDSTQIKTEGAAVNVVVSWTPQNQDQIDFLIPVAGLLDFIGPTITTNILPSGAVGVGYFSFVTATGGIQPYTWSISSGSLPPGLSIAAGTGLISGTPTATGFEPLTYNFVVDVTDSDIPPATASRPLSILINP